MSNFQEILRGNRDSVGTRDQLHATNLSKHRGSRNKRVATTDPAVPVLASVRIAFVVGFGVKFMTRIAE